jgi:transcriptional regulator NrdR family protein
VRTIKDIQVVKKGGGNELWSIDKLVASITKTGLALEIAEAVSSKIEDWVKKAAVNGKIESSTIRDRVIETLKGEDPAAADSYRAYKG